MYLSLVWTAVLVLVLCLTACGHIGLQFNRRTYCYVLSSISPYGGRTFYIRCDFINQLYNYLCPTFVFASLVFTLQIVNMYTCQVTRHRTRCSQARHTCHCRAQTRVTVRHKHWRLIADIWPGILQFLDNF